MNTIFYDAFEQALDDLESGTDIDSILASNPTIEPKLRPLLETAMIARSAGVIDPPQKVLNDSRKRLLVRSMELHQEPKSHWSFFRYTPRLVYVFVLALVFLMSFSGLSIASAQALPGDQLYPFKRVAENIRLSFAVSPDNHQAMEDRYQARRVDEVKLLMTSARTAFVEFFGKVNSQDADRWNIGGVDVHLTSETIIIGDIPLGAIVEVEGATVPGGWVQAAEIHLQTFGFVGYVDSISQDAWRIGGSTVLITQDSRIASGIQVGEWVVVSVRSDDLGNLYVQLIDKSNLATPIPDPTRTDSPTIEHPMPTLTSTLDLIMEGTDDEIDQDEDLSGDDGEDEGADDSEDDGTDEGIDGDGNDNDDDVEGSEGDDQDDDEEGVDEEDEDEDEPDEEDEEDEEDDEEDEEKEDEDEDEKGGD